MFSQLFVQIFALYKFVRKNLRKKRRKFSMDPICFIRLFRNIALALCLGTTSGPLGDHLESGFRYICFVQLSDAFHA